MFPFARCSLAAAVAFAATSPAYAGSLQFTVRTATGGPAANAVVSVYPTAGSHTPVAGGELVMAQKDIAFAPFVLIAPLGAVVSFPNRDTVRHHVYSFSAPHRFELKLYGREEHRTEHFDKPGPVALGCNIHDSMSAFIYVADTRFVAKTDALGRVSISDLPAGPAQVKVWHPYVKAPGATVAKTLTIGAGETTDGLTVDLRPPPPGKQDH